MTRHVKVGKKVVPLAWATSAVALAWEGEVDEESELVLERAVASAEVELA